jgi:chromosome segregation ATPase
MAERAILEIVAEANDALKEFDRLEREFREATEKMGAALDKNVQSDEAVKELDRLERNAQEVGEEMQRAGRRSAKALRDLAKTGRVAGQSLEQLEEDIVDVEKRLGRARRAMQTFGTTSKKVAATTRKAFSGVGTAVTKLRGAFVALGGALILREITRATERQAQAEAVLNNLIETTGGAAGLTAAELKKMASEMQSVTLFGDEMVIEAQNILLTFTKIGREVFPEATKRAADLATILAQGSGGEVDLKAAAIQLGKALNDPIANLSALSRAGIQFSEDQKETIKGLVESNRLLDAQKIILAELEKQFGGTAEAARDRLGGAFAALRVRSSDLFEVIGRGGLLSALDRVSESILGATEAAEKGKGGFQDLGRFLGLLTTAVSALAKGLGTVRALALGVGALFLEVWENVLFVITKIFTALEKIPLLKGRFTEFLASVQSAFENTEQAANDLGQRAEASLKGIGEGLRKDFEFMKQLIAGTVEETTALGAALGPAGEEADKAGDKIAEFGDKTEEAGGKVETLTTAATALNNILEEQQQRVADATASVAALEETVAELEGRQAQEGILSPEDLGKLFEAQDQLADSRFDLAEASNALEQSELSVLEAAGGLTDAQKAAADAASLLTGEFDLAAQAAALTAAALQDDLKPIISEVAVETRRAADGTLELVNTLEDTGLVLGDAADGTKELTQAQDEQTVTVTKLADGTFEMKNAIEEADEKTKGMIETLTDALTPAENIQENLEKIGDSANKGVSKAVGELQRLEAAANEAAAAIADLNDGVGNLTDQAG